MSKRNTKTDEEYVLKNNFKGKCNEYWNILEKTIVQINKKKLRQKDTEYKII